MANGGRHDCWKIFSAAAGGAIGLGALTWYLHRWKLAHSKRTTTTAVPPQGQGSQAQSTSRQSLAGAIHRSLSLSLRGVPENPFDDMPRSFPEDHSYPYTNLPVPFLEKLFKVLRPAFLVEVGCFKGGSTLRIGDAAVATARGDLPCLLSIDTFLGDAGMWLDRNPGWRAGLLLEHGFPRLYWQFLVNVERLRDVVVPLPLASLSALRVVQHLILEGVVPAPTFIYLDSAHEKGETFQEIVQAFKMLAAGGVIVGDDLDWPAVETDLRAFVAGGAAVSGAEDPVFSSLPGLAFHPDGGYWILNSAPPQWLLRKSAGDLEDLRAHVHAEEDGENPTDYVPLTEEDHRALKFFEDAVACSEAGKHEHAARLYKKAASLSASLAHYYQLS